MSALPKTGLAMCGPCGELVRWAVTAAGKRQALNPDPDPAGNTAAYCDGLGTWRSRVPTTDLPQAGHERLFMPHAATCTAAKQTPRQLPAGVVSLAGRRRTNRRSR